MYFKIITINEHCCNKLSIFFPDTAETKTKASQCIIKTEKKCQFKVVIKSIYIAV